MLTWNFEASVPIHGKMAALSNFIKIYQKCILVYISTSFQLFLANKKFSTLFFMFMKKI